jgi:hypothetical protein
MPDLESFIVSAKNQEGLKSGIKRKKKRGKGDDEFEEDLDETALLKKKGTRTRPIGG